MRERRREFSRETEIALRTRSRVSYRGRAERDREASQLATASESGTDNLSSAAFENPLTLARGKESIEDMFALLALVRPFNSHPSPQLTHLLPPAGPRDDVVRNGRHYGKSRLRRQPPPRFHPHPPHLPPPLSRYRGRPSPPRHDQRCPLPPPLLLVLLPPFDAVSSNSFRDSSLDRLWRRRPAESRNLQQDPPGVPPEGRRSRSVALCVAQPEGDRFCSHDAAPQDPHAVAVQRGWEDSWSRGCLGRCAAVLSAQELPKTDSPHSFHRFLSHHVTGRSPPVSSFQSRRSSKASSPSSAISTPSTVKDSPGPLVSLLARSSSAVVALHHPHRRGLLRGAPMTSSGTSKRGRVRSRSARRSRFGGR